MNGVQQALRKALSLHNQGQLAPAEALYRSILHENPNHADAHCLLGVIEFQRRNHGAALALFARAAMLDPRSALALVSVGNALLALGRPAEAIASYERALGIDPKHTDALNNRANALCALERPAEALAGYERVLELDPGAAEVHFNHANVLLKLHRAQQALAGYERAIALNPAYAAALNNRGTALRELGRPLEALDSYERALAIESNFAEAMNNCATALLELKRPAQALDACERALALNGDYPEALKNQGAALLELDRPEQALRSYERLLAIHPEDAEARYRRGTALRALRRPQEALESYERALAVKPDQAAVLCDRGNALLELDRPEEALTSYARALAIEPRFTAAIYNGGRALARLNRHEEAARRFTQLLELQADFPYARGDLLGSQLQCCDWRDYGRLVESIGEQVRAGARAATPFAFLSVADSPQAQLRCARTYAEDRHAGAALPAPTGASRARQRIRVAYLSADYCNHATAYLAAGLFEAHDSVRFETVGISFGPERHDEMRERLTRAFTRFVDVRERSDREVALLLREFKIDIAVDLKGYTRDSRPGILAFRPAPIQVNYLGYPGTMGAKHIDYLIADRFVIPEREQPYYAEQIAYLPETYQPNDATRRIGEHVPTRAQAGLPAQGFVFCSFNSNYKITPAMFDCWMRVLAQVPGSVLWLLASNAAAMRNLRLHAQSRGVDAERLRFAERVTQEQHLARHRLAGLFLDNLPINAHTTASDALWAGLPVLTCPGRSFAGRVAGSPLAAVGLPELIAPNLEDFEARAIALARDEQSLGAIRARLARNRQSFPLFDTSRLCRHLERAYEMMWQRFERGEPPAGFAVPACD